MSKSKPFLSDAMRGFLASCLVIISAFILAINIVGLNARDYIPVVITDVIFALALWAYISLFTGVSKSELLKRTMLLFSILATFISAFLSWFVVTFSL
jgi:hypothetical protein